MGTKEEALQQINELKRQMKIKPYSRLFCCMHGSDKNYVCSFENLDRILENYLEKVSGLVGEYNLGDEVYLRFRQEAAETLYNSALKRNETEWAEYFLKKYGLAQKNPEKSG